MKEKFINFLRRYIKNDKLVDFIDKRYDVLVYLVFGGLTTVVNFAVLFPCVNVLGMSPTVGNTVAWIVAVAFAYVTNKPFVFESHDWSVSVVGPELAKFVSTRIGSLVIEDVILFVTVQTFGWNLAIWKLVTQVLVIIINYVGSKLLVFRKK